MRSNLSSNCPKGIYSRLGAGGIKLSGGQFQRLAIARAIIRNPRVLILDEATSALDVESEILVQQAIEQIMKDRTTFIVAHRISTVRNADRIAILDEGRFSEIGSPDELLRNDNFYSKAVRQMQHGTKTDLNSYGNKIFHKKGQRIYSED